jgi:hypothetical protein
MTMKNHKAIFSVLLFFLVLSACEKGEILIETGAASDIFTTTATVTGNILSIGDGIKQYGHCYSTTPNPVFSGLKTEYHATIGTGTFTSYLQGLEPGTKYYVRAYGSLGNYVAYGTEISFTTSLTVAP